jgi:hypothetical protein
MRDILCDQQLLELAAKSAGIEIEKYHENEELDFEYRVMEIDSEDGAWMRLWNPLDDDGDALRLAVALCIDITVMKNKALYTHTELCAETRRAIVTAAAEIGKS